MRKRSSVKTTAPVRSCSCWAYVLFPAQGSPEIKWAVDILIGTECYTTDGNGDSSRRIAARVRLIAVVTMQADAAGSAMVDRTQNQATIQENRDSTPSRIPLKRRARVSAVVVPISPSAKLEACETLEKIGR